MKRIVWITLGLCAIAVLVGVLGLGGTKRQQPPGGGPVTGSAVKW